MSVVISEVEHRPLADGASETSADTRPASVQPPPMAADCLFAVLRREASRRSRLWAD